MKNLTHTEIRILNRIQTDWHITETPFKELSAELSIDEENLIQSINTLKKAGIIRDISAIFNAESLGYDSALIAFKVPEKNIEKTASIINRHPGVSHNYLRDHNYNIWFTLAAGPDNSLENEANILAQESKADDFLIFRNEKLLKIGLVLNIGDEEGIPETAHIQAKKKIQVKNLSPEEKKAVYILQSDLPPAHRPFKELLQRTNLDISEERIVQLGELLKEQGVMRRYSAILKHDQAGYNYNAMTAWKINPDDNNSINIFLSVKNISHLYIRNTYPGKWEHGLFAMIHAKTKDELDKIIKRLEKDSGIKDYLVLHSLKEFKKQRVKYFTEEFSENKRI